jgi:predicted MFS family arabinose efflux permease
VLMGMTIAVPTLSLAMLWPLPVVCVCAFGAGLAVEVMMVRWTVALARHIPPDKLARVSSYDAVGSTMTMPVGALVAGPLAAAIGVSATQYAAVLLILASSALALIPRQIRTIRSGAAATPQPAVADQPAGAAGIGEPVIAGAPAGK